MNRNNEMNTDNNFGLPRPEFRPLEPNGNRKWLRVTLMIALAVILLGTAIVWWLLQGTLKNKLSSIYHPKNSKDEIPKIDNRLELEMADRLEDEMAGDLETLSKEFRTQQQEIAPAIETINSPTGLYHVIAASCVDYDLVMDSAKNLVKKGISSKIIMPIPGKKPFVRLSVAQYKTYKEAAENIQVLKSEHGESIWVMKY